MAEFNELITKFEFEGNLNPLNQYNDLFGNSVELMTKSIGIATTLAGGLLALSNSTLGVVDSLEQLSRETNTSIEYLQEMGYVASVNGGSVEALQSSIIGLSEKIGEAAQQGSEDFNRLGISVVDANGNIKSTERVLGEVSGRFKSLSKAEQVSFAQKLGIDKSLLQTLNLTNEQLTQTKEIAQAFGIVTKEQAQEVVAFNDNLTTLKFGFNAIGQQIALSFNPQMKALTDTFIDFLLANKDLIKNSLSKFIEVTGSVLKAITNTGRGIYQLIDATIGVEAALMLAGGAAIYFGRALFMNPVGLVIGLIAGLVLVVDDLVTAFDGGESVVGNFFAAFDVDIVNRIKLFMGELKVGLVQITSLITSALLALGNAGKFLGLNIDTSSLEEMKKIRENFIQQQRKENSELIRNIEKKEGALSSRDIASQISNNNNLLPGGAIPLSNINTANQTVTNNITVNANGLEGTAKNLEDTLVNALNNANNQIQIKGR